MNVTWKQQHFNNSCASACVAMLLSQYGIDKQDDDVITETMMPYRITYQPDEGGQFMAGVLLEDAATFTSMLLRNQLMLKYARIAKWPEFQTAAGGLLAKDRAFMASVPTCLIPSSGYDQVRKQGDRKRKHGVVIYGQQGNDYLVLDPSGGLARNQEHQYQVVKNQVDLRLPHTAMAEAFGIQDYACTVGHLDEWNGDRGLPVTQVLNQSRAALDAFGAKADQFKQDIAGSVPARHADILYSYLARAFKPIALDWRTAIEAQQAKAKPQYQLIEGLYRLQDTIMRQQKKLDAAPGVDPGFCDELTTAVKAIIVAGKEHLSTAQIVA